MNEEHKETIDIKDLEIESLFINLEDDDTIDITKAGPGEEYDYEGYMVKTQLRRMNAQSKELIDIISDDEQFPAWIQSKVTLASEYMDGVYDFYKYGDYTITSDKSIEKSAEVNKYMDAGESPYIYIDEELNNKNMEVVSKFWQLGPENASEDPEANPEFWSNMATAWLVDEKTARRQTCANCEYFNNTPKAQAAMDNVPFNSFDADGGGRGYCVKFKFICHNLRTCLAWEEKDFYHPD